MRIVLSRPSPWKKSVIRMGWGENVNGLPYLLLYYEKGEECRRLIAESDVVLFGGVEDESLIADRLRAGRLTVRLSERLYREGNGKPYLPGGLIKNITTIPATGEDGCICSAPGPMWREISGWWGLTAGSGSDTAIFPLSGSRIRRS